MTTTHTPGPWAYEQEFDNSTDFWVFQANGPARIACEVSERDAALIAAAPELLAALQQCLRYGGLYPDLAEHVRTVVDRATGA
jgi:hypothetical protein